MLTVDLPRLPIGPGTRLLDLGLRAVRVAFEAGRRVRVVALDTDRGELRQGSAIVLAGCHPTSADNALAAP